MASHTYTILPEQAQEDALHATRLLQVEERPFQRVTRNLLGKDSPLRWTPRQLPSPPPEGGDEAAGTDEAEVQRRERFREDILLDFAALESSILRIQLIQSSNARERERYAAEKAKITETAQGVKDNTFSLRTQLAEAQRVLELRKGYDELAAKLIDPQKLKPRADTKQDISKLEKEIEDLEQESAEFEGVWMGRREGFDKVVAEGQNLVKIIKGIKDEPELEAEIDDAMDEVEDGVKGERSRMGTPAPGEPGSTPIPELPGGETPLPEGGVSPVRSQAVNKFLDVDDVGTGTRGSSRVGSPMGRAEGDVEMMVEEQALQQKTDTDMGVESVVEQVATPAEVMDES